MLGNDDGADGVSDEIGSELGLEEMMDEAEPVTSGGETIGLHVNAFGIPPKWICGKCGEIFENDLGLQTHYGKQHADADEAKERVTETREESFDGRPSETADPVTGATAADPCEFGTAADAAKEKAEATKSTDELWKDALWGYQSSGNGAVKKADARDAVVAALKKEAEWMSVVERCSPEHSDLWVHRGDGEPWDRDGWMYVATRMRTELGAHTTSREVKHIIDQLAWDSDHQVNEDELNAGNDECILVNVGNGVLDVTDAELDEEGRVDVDTVELLDNDTEWYWTYKIEAEWDHESADLDGLDEWLAEIQSPIKCDATGEIWHEPQMRFWEFAGHALVTVSVADGFLVLLGEGANGKSMSIGLLQGMLGEDNTSSIAVDEIQQNRFKAYNVVDRLLNVDSDMEGEKMRSMGTLKKMAAGERMHVEAKGEQGFMAKNSATMICAADDPPALPQRNEAAGRRLYVVEYPVTYKSNPDPDNPLELQKRPKREVKRRLHSDARLKAALVRAVGGLVRLLNNGEFTSDRDSDERIELYETWADPCMDFRRKALVAKPGTGIEQSDLKATFDAFAQDQDHPGKSWKTLKNQLEKTSDLPMRRQRTRSFSDGSSQETVYEGIAFTPAAVKNWVPEDAHWEAGAYKEHAGVEDDDGYEAPDADLVDHPVNSYPVAPPIGGRAGRPYQSRFRATQQTSRQASSTARSARHCTCRRQTPTN